MRTLLQLLKSEVVPAIGCTEPVAVSLAAAKVARLLNASNSDIASIQCRLSGNIIKNAMGVGIPGTGMIGLPIAIALGALIGRPELGLEVLADVSPQAVERAKQLISRNVIDIALAPEATDVLYIDVTLTTTAGRSAQAIIVGSHCHFAHLRLDGQELCPDSLKAAASPAESSDVKLNLRRVWDFAMTCPEEELEFILETRRLNKAAAERALMNPYGHRVGRILHSERQRSVMGDTTFSRILSHTAAACDARMGGAPVAVMSNSGSGNQGIAATLPVVIYAEETYADRTHTIRALTLSHLTSIYIKQGLGKLSALCGCMTATIGSGAGICYLMGGGYEQMVATVKNMVANLTGMICDGAKPGCALKLTSGVSTAVISAMLAMENVQPNSLEGIIDDDVDRTIANLTAIGHDGMTQTDALILAIMTSK